MGYRPSLRETSKNTLQGAEGSGGGTSRVCRLSSPIWGGVGSGERCYSSNSHSFGFLKTDSYLYIWIDKLKHRSDSGQRLVL